MREVVIVSAARTPIGKFMGGLSGLRAPELGAHAIRAALERAKVAPDLVDEVIMGCVLQAGLGQNPARQAAIRAGVPTSRGSFTVNKVCGSGLKAVMLAAQAIRAGDADVIVAGGMESMSGAPHLLPKSREGFRLGHATLVDSMINDGLWDIYNDFHMGNTAELVSAELRVSREDQDRYALASQEKAVKAQRAGALRAEIAPVSLPQKKGDPIVIDADEGPRADATYESLAKLKPAFQKEGGTVTAGNASTINDGGAALVVMSGEKAEKLGVKPLARITGYATGGRDPKWVMMAPVEAINALLAKTGMKSAADFDLLEVNEAFAAASVALARELGIPEEKLNVNGGAIALGHPIGASGARILTTLLYAMAARDAKTGLAALCLGGGNAVALGVERV